MNIKGNSFNHSPLLADASVNMTMSKQLKVLLSSHRLTVTELSKATKISSKTIYHYLDGRSPRNLVHVKTICDYFKVSSDYLLFGVDKSKKDPMAEYLEEVRAGFWEVILRRPK